MITVRTSSMLEVMVLGMALTTVGNGYHDHGTHDEAARVAENGEKTLRQEGAWESLCRNRLKVCDSGEVLDIVTVGLLQREHSATFPIH